MTQGFPQLTAPLVGPDGRITTPWLSLFSALWTRTGSAPGVNTVTVSGNAADAQLLAAFGDDPAAPPPDIASYLPADDAPPPEEITALGLFEESAPPTDDAVMSALMLGADWT